LSSQISATVITTEPSSEPKPPSRFEKKNTEPLYPRRSPARVDPTPFSPDPAPGAVPPAMRNQTMRATVSGCAPHEPHPT
jgi:hypothetical protein